MLPFMQVYFPILHSFVENWLKRVVLALCSSSRPEELESPFPSRVGKFCSVTEPGSACSSAQPRVLWICSRHMMGRSQLFSFAPVFSPFCFVLVSPGVLVFPKLWRKYCSTCLGLWLASRSFLGGRRREFFLSHHMFPSSLF